MRAEVYETITEIYRADQQLPDPHQADRGRAPERLPAPRAPRRALRGDRRLDEGARDLQEGARRQSEADRSAAQDDPRAAVAGRARQGDRRVRGAHSRRPEQSAVRVRAVRGAHAARRSRARAQAPHRARGSRPERRRGAVAPRRFLRPHRRERSLAQGARRASRRSAPTTPGTSPISATAISRTETRRSPSRRGSGSSPR